MINRTVVGAHYGLRDWLAQRATAVIMAVYTFILGAILLVVRPASFEAWQGVFAAVTPKQIYSLADQLLMEMKRS